MSPSGRVAPPPETEGTAPGARGLRLFGVPVRLHFTFVLLVLFLVFTGAQGGQSAINQILYIVAMFASVVLHELGHAGVARRYGIATLDIVLYPIGGVARLERNPRPAEELWIALAGPAVNVLIAAGIFAVLAGTSQSLNPNAVVEPKDANVLTRIAFGNVILAAFNMLPAFPMDGGRVLRAVMARRTTEEVATRRAAAAGRAFSILIGLTGLLTGQFMLLFIALFVYIGATQENLIVQGRALTSGAAVRDAMVTDFRTLQHGNTVRDAANLLLATSQHDFPVVLGDQVIGLLNRTALLRGMAENGPDAYIAGIMDRNFPRVKPYDDLNDALPIMAQTSCALVMDSDRLLGLLTRENVSEFLMIRKIGMEQSAKA